MGVVYKYQLVVTDRQKVTMPKDAKVLTIQVQNGTPCIWAMVEPKNPEEEVTIRIHGTGHNISDTERLEYIGTFQWRNYGFVFHAFKEKQDEGIL